MSQSWEKTPLPERMRPRTLDEVVGQEHLLGEEGFLREAIAAGNLPSLILWGPPGTGKTTLARLLADAFDAQFVPMSAVLSGVADIREQLAAAEDTWRMFQRPTILFVDEIHRFNKAQQDALLPDVEAGSVRLIGATTEHPGFEVNAALLSRCKTLILEALGPDEIDAVLQRALRDEERGLGGRGLTLDDDARDEIVRHADGDARAALTTLAVAARAVGARGDSEITLEAVERAAQQRATRYDKAGEAHYNTVSAFIKSLRGSDPDASLYYMMRMLEGGEDPMFVLRRMVIFASEDIGNADPRALRVALDAREAVQFVGLPEGVLPMSQAVAYLASAPKSNTALTSYAAARRDVREHGNLPLPPKLLNAPTELHKEQGFGRGYKYPHNFDGHYVAGESYLPERLRGQRYYEPSDSGFEAEIRHRLGLDDGDEDPHTS